MSEAFESTGNQVAPPGKVYVCAACGKRSRDKYGEQALHPLWDESCMMNAVLVDEDTLVVGKTGLVTGLKGAS